MITSAASHKKGIALFIAVIAVSALLLISFSIADISYKQQLISAAGRDSKGAFYAADTGLECALYHDLKVENFFPTNSPGGGTITNLWCDDREILGGTVAATSGATTTSNFKFDIGNAHCVDVTVEKGVDLGTGDITTYVTSRGYNTTCANLGAGNSLRNVERALEVSY